jgi:hypothetical protein
VRRAAQPSVAAIALLAFLPVNGAGQPAARDGWQDRQGATLTRLVEQVTGPVPEPCGIAWLAKPFTYPEREVAEGLSCVLQARGLGRASWALWQFPGIDSTVFGGVASTPRGEVQLLHYDNFGGRDDLDATPCVNPRVSTGPGVGIGCDNRMVALSAAELVRALERLDDDVVQTAGETYRGLAARLAKAAQDEPRPDSSTLSAHPGFLTRVVDDVQLEIQGATGSNWPVCPRHGGHPLDFRDHRWFCALDAAFLAELGGLGAISRRSRP